MNRNVSMALLLGGLMLLSSCSRLVFYPYDKLIRTPADVSLAYRDVYLQTSDNVKVHAWFLETSEPAKGTVLFLHGNGENISTHIASVGWLPSEGYQVLLLDYRGYGVSQGTPTLSGAIKDIASAIQWLESSPQVNSKPLYMLGQSLGASLAIYTAGQPEYKDTFDGVIAEAGFTGYRDIASDFMRRSKLFRWFRYPLSFVLTGEYAAKDAVAHIAPTPLLIIHSPDDQVIPYKHGMTLYSLAEQPKSLLTTKGRHIISFAFAEYREELVRFLGGAE